MLCEEIAQSFTEMEHPLPGGVLSKCGSGSDAKWPLKQWNGIRQCTPAALSGFTPGLDWLGAVVRPRTKQWHTFWRIHWRELEVEWVVYEHFLLVSQPLVFLIVPRRQQPFIDWLAV